MIANLGPVDECVIDYLLMQAQFNPVGVPAGVWDEYVARRFVGDNAAMVYALAREMKFQREMRALRRREKEGLREMAAQQARDARPAVPLSAPATIDGVAIGTEPAKAAGAQAETERPIVAHRLASRHDDPAPVTPENWQRLSDEQEARLQAEGYFTLEQAAAALNAQQGGHNEARKTLLLQMTQAARTGALTVRHPHTLLPYAARPDACDYYELVRPSDVNDWLDSCKAPYRWNAPAGEPEPAPNEVGGAEESAPVPQAPNAKRWTPELVAEARAMRDKLKGAGATDYTKRTADHLGVSPAFLRKLLQPSKDAPASSLSGWPPAKGKVHRAR